MPAEKRKNEEEEEEDLRKMTYLHGGALVESFSPQGRRATLLFSVRLHEGASARPRRGTMAALRLRLRLGTPFTTMISIDFIDCGVALREGVTLVYFISSFFVLSCGCCIH